MECFKKLLLTLSAVLHTLYSKCTRTKTVGADFLDTQMKRCLKIMDITFLGTGHMIGAGIYILTGKAVREIAGPSIIVSYLLSGFAAFLSALMYAEFGGRVPKAGSAYSYGYVTVGEFWGFIIGWDMLLENMIGAAALGVAWSGYLDTLTNGQISASLNSTIGEIHDPNGIIGDHLELIAPALILVVSVFMGLGARVSTNFNTVFAVINLIVIAFTVIFGLTFARGSNWTDPSNCTQYMDCTKNNETCTSKDAFLPFGFSGVMHGAAEVFFAYVGFESIASAGEETINPQRTIPLGTLFAMVIVTTCYILMSLTVTLMVPFCQVDVKSAFATVFKDRGSNWAQYVVAAGALSGMTTVLFGSLFATPRGVYAMSIDGLLCKFLGYIHPRSQVPIVGVIFFGLISAIFSMIFNLSTLADMVSIGTLMAYSIVACSVIVLRYRPFAANVGSKIGTVIEPDPDGGRLKKKFHFLNPLFGNYEPGAAVATLSGIMVIMMFCLAAVIQYGTWSPVQWWSIVLLVIFALAALTCVLMIFAHQPAKANLLFKVPWVPFLPALSLLINIIFMLYLHGMTWLRFGIWLFIGCIIYFGYGMWHSNENQLQAKTAGAFDAKPRHVTLSAPKQELSLSDMSEKVLSEKTPPPFYYSTESDDHVSTLSVNNEPNHRNSSDGMYSWKRK